MTYPLAPLGVRIRIAPFTTDYSADPATYPWIDITPDIDHLTEIVDEIGGEDDVSEENTSLSFAIKNESGRYTSNYAESDLYPNFDLGCPIEYALDVGDGTGFKVIVVTYLGRAVNSWPANTQYKCRATITAGGQFRRLGLKPRIASALYRTVLSSAKRKAFWPGEDASGSTAAASAIPAQLPMTSGVGLPPDFGQTSLVPGAGSMVSFSAGSNLAAVLTSPTAASAVRASFLMHWDQQPAANTDLLVLYHSNSTARHLVRIHPTDLIQLQSYNAAGAEISGAGTIAFGSAHSTGTVWFELDLTQTAANTVTYTLRETAWSIAADGQPVGAVNFFTGTFSGIVGQISAYSISPNLQVDGITMGMWALTEAPLPGAGGFNAVVGWAGNTAAGRVDGMCNEFGVPHSVTSTALGVVMGPQRTDSLLANLRDVKATDHGVLTDHTGVVKYRALSELYNLAPAITLSRSGARGQLGDVTSTRDDTAKVNRASASRPGGSTAMAENAADIAAHGLFEREPIEVNVATDSVLAGHAGWSLARGVSNGHRYSGFTLNMRVAAEYTPSLAPAVLALQLGDRIAVSSLPPQAAKGSIERQVRGRVQTVVNRGMRKWEITYKAVPIEAYQAFQVDVSQLDTSGTEISAVAANSTDTTLMVSTAGAPIKTGGGQSVQLDAAGERIVMTACADEPITDPFTRVVVGGWGSIPATTHVPAITWIPAGGQNADHAVNGTQATQSNTAAPASRTCFCIGYAATNIDLSAYGSYAVVPAGANLELQIGYRYVTASNNAYVARIAIEVGNTVRLQLFAPNNAVLADIPTTLTHSASVVYGLRVAPINGRHRVRVWQGTSANEPTTWQIDLQDTQRLIPGNGFTIRSGRASGNSNVSPVIATWDNISINNTQALTVTRSADGVIKAQPLFSKIKLWRGRGLGI